MIIINENKLMKANENDNVAKERNNESEERYRKRMKAERRK